MTHHSAAPSSIALGVTRIGTSGTGAASRGVDSQLEPLGNEKMNEVAVGPMRTERLRVKHLVFSMGDLLLLAITCFLGWRRSVQKSKL